MDVAMVRNDKELIFRVLLQVVEGVGTGAGPNYRLHLEIARTRVQIPVPDVEPVHVI